jgi:hypothetical protein
MQVEVWQSQFTRVGRKGICKFFGLKLALEHPICERQNEDARPSAPCPANRLANKECTTPYSGARIASNPKCVMDILPSKNRLFDKIRRSGMALGAARFKMPLKIPFGIQERTLFVLEK